MKLSVFNPVLADKTLEEALEYLNSLDVKAIEVGVGGYPGNAHLNPEEYLNKPDKIIELKDLLTKYDIEIAALSCHNNPVSPDRSVAIQAHAEFEMACLLAQQLDVKTVITFSGCPGDHPEAINPNWVTCAWPPEFQDILNYQWHEVLIPYWQEACAFAQKCNVRVALEIHPGFCVYNTETMVRLRDAVGSNIGANFDPSHLFWQGIDPNYALRVLKDCLFHFHAKDTYVDPINTKTTGVLDTKPYDDYLNRSWSFRSVGYGHSLSEWKEIFSTLRMIGYDGYISIEHEDGLMSTKEGLEKAIAFLHEAIIKEQPGEMYWT